MKKLGKIAISIIILSLVGLVIGYLIESFVENGKIIWASSYILGTYSGTAVGVVLAVYGFYLFSKMDTSKIPAGGGGSKNDKKKKKKQDDQQYFAGDWLTESEMKKRFYYTRFSQIKNNPISKCREYKGGCAVVIKAELIGAPTKGKDMTVCLAEPIHTLVVGNTRSGKGESFVIPNIQILSELDTKPSFVITDPKGELYDINVSKLRKKGYNIKVFDLRYPFKSDRWNPLSHIYDTFQKYLNLRKDVFIHNNETPKQCGLKYSSTATFGESWFEFNGEAYPTELDMETAVKGTEQVLLGEINADIRDIINIIVPIDDPKNAMWVNGARDFASSILLAMLEDSANSSLGMTREKYNFFNFYNVINIRSDDPDDVFSILKEYVSGRRYFNTKQLATQVTTSAPTTASSFMATLLPALSLFADPAIDFVTSDTEIDFSTISSKPTAFFIKTNDEKPIYDKIAGMLVEQLYKNLAAQATSGSGKLNRGVIFLLDEFGNLPKFDNMGNYISVGAGRNIFFYLVVQGLSQLNTTYGDSLAKTIKNNCNIKVYIGSNEMETLKEFNEMCGKRTVTVKDVSTSKGEGKDGGKSKSESEKEQQRDLIFVEELQQLKEDHLIVVMAKSKPLKTICTRSHKCHNVYDKKDIGEEFRPNRFMDIDKISYSINGYLNTAGNNKRNDYF